MRPEFRLLAACCRWPVDPDAVRAAFAEAGDTLDWHAFVDLIDRHRVAGLACHALRVTSVSMPAAAETALSARSRAVVAANLVAAQEMLRLYAAFQKSGVDLLFFKGLTLASLAYGEAFRKQGWDIDVLIDHAALAEAATLLRAAGYHQIRPEPDQDEGGDARLARWHEVTKDSEWRHPKWGMSVELHTRFNVSPLFLPGLGLASPRQQVSIPGGTVPTLAREGLFTLLCVHGTHCGWFRLKWLADLAAWLNSMSVAEIAELNETAARHAPREIATAFLLAHDLLGVIVPSEILQAARADRGVRLLARIAKSSLTATDTPVFPKRPLGSALLHLIPVIALADWRQRRAEIARQLFLPVERDLADRPVAPRRLALPLLGLAFVVRRVGRAIASRLGPAARLTRRAQ